MVMAKDEKFQRSLSLPSQYILPTMPTSLKKRRNGLGYIFYGQQPVDVQLILSQLKFARTASYCFRMNAPFCNQQTSQLTLLTELSSYVDADNNDDILNEIIDDVDVDSDGFESMSSVTGESYPAESESRPHCVFYISDCNSPITLPTTNTTTATPRQKEDLETVVSQQTVTSAAASHSHIAQHLSTQTAESYDNTSTLPVNVTGDSSKVHQAKRSDMGRRNALADIFSGIPEDKVVDFLSEYSFCEKAVTTSDEIYLSDSLENCKSGIEDSCTVSACETVLVDLDLDLNMRKNGLSQLPRNRRRAMADIFDGIHEQDRQRLFELHETLPSDEERDILASERRHSRRHALGDIFSHTSADELSRLRSEYSR